MQRTSNITNIFQFINRYRRCTLAALMLVILMLGWTASAHASYSYRKRITIDHTKVGSSCSHVQDFAVLIDIRSDSNLKTVANGGHVFNSSGYDIVFKDESGNQLDHEIMRYNGSDGSFQAFVRVPQVSSLSDTIIYIHYGNASVSSSQENKTGVWDSDYEAVLHLQESGNGSSDEYKDSTGNGHHGTGGGLAGSGNNTYTPDLVNGLFGYAQDFDNRGGHDDYSSDLIFLDEVNDQAWDQITVQAWVNTDGHNQYARWFCKAWGGAPNLVWSLTQSWSNTRGRVRTQSNNLDTNAGAHPTNTWILATTTWKASDGRLSVYRNGIKLNDRYLAGSTLYDHNAVPTIGALPTHWNGYDGQIQEVRLSKVARTACWLKTEYNNQISPATFYSLGAEEAAGIPTYTISAAAGAGGTITPVGDQHVESGNDVSFTIAAAGGYEISDVVVDTFSQGVQSSWTFSGVISDHDITAYFTAIPSGDPPPDTPVLNGCGAGDVDVSYADGFADDGLTMINTQVDDVTKHVVLKTGFAAIDKENIVIPFEQEVFVNALYTAGRNDLGYSLLEDMVDGDGNFIGWNNIPVDKREGFFRGTWDSAQHAGDGVFDDSYGYGNFPENNEAAIAAYDDGTGRPFLVDGDGVVSPKDMRKSLGTFAGGTEIVLWMVGQDFAQHYDDPVLSADTLKVTFYNKHEWNPDFYASCDPGYSPFDKIYRLGEPGIEGLCMVDGGWLQPGATDRLLEQFNLTMANSVYRSPVTIGEKYHHFIVGAPANEPNQWILGVEQNNNQINVWSDVDCNDMVYKIERKTGGMVELDAAHAITSGSEDISFTGVTLKVWDYMPCVNDNEINYELSIDNGVTWVSVIGWDEIHESNESKDILGAIDSANWEPGSPEYTYRTIRIDFSSLSLTGHEIRWRASLISQDEACEPKILDLAISATTMSDAEVSRAGPVVKANVLYSGSYEILSSGSDEELRGHLRATRIYDPTNPDETNIQPLWDAGEVLNNKDPADRDIYFPNITVVTFSEQIGTGLGPGVEDDDNKIFSGTLAHHPIQAASVTITDTHESFTDKHTDVLEGNLGGAGKIDRFSGGFSVTFDTPPNAGVPIMAHYKYYVSASDLWEFKKNPVTAEMLAIDDSEIIGKGYTYDFDGNGSFDADADTQWLVNWVRGSEDGTGNKKAWLLGAIDHSVQAVQTPPSLPNWYYGTATTRAEREGFWSFVQDQKDRPTVVYTGARDGMLHAFDGGTFSHGDNDATGGIEEHRGYFTDYGTGEELWAFIPANLIPRLKNNVLQGDDQAYVDASPALADVYVGGSWKTVLLCAQGNGGDTIFALDVTDPENPTFMWEFADPDLFRSRSSPSIGKIGRILVDGQAVWVAFFVSGKTYDVSLYPSIYMINVADGSVVERVMLDDDASGTGGVPSGQPSIVDSDGNGYIDRLYIGTDKGFLYKVNIPDDPDTVKYGISNCVINRDFTDEQDTPSSVPVDQRYHPIYGSPVVIVNNGLDSGGAVTYDIKILFGTGDSPYFDEDIDMGNTRYHFFVYRDQAKKGECDNSQVFLDWFYELPEGHRIFASAFAAAGQVYFGTATSETEDPCDTPSTSGLSSLGDLYAFDIASGTKIFQKQVGNTTITPIVVDKHLYVKSQSAEVQSFGEGKYNNATIMGGFPKVEIRAWHEIF